MTRTQQADQQLLEIRSRLRNAALATIIVFTVGVTGYEIIGHGRHRLIDALYMTVITLTTVGYGEIIPMDNNPGGRIFTMVLLLFGMGILVYFASTVTAFFVEGQLEQVFWRKRMKKAISELREHFIVCGDRLVAAHVIDELRRVHRPVVAVVPVGSTPPPVTEPGELPYIEGDPADEDVLKEAGIMRAAGVVAAMESDRENVLVTLTARQTNPIMRIVSMLMEGRNDAKLRRAGADAVVSPSGIGGLRMASEMIRPKVVTFLDSMLRDRDRNLRIEEITIGRGSHAIGKPLSALDVNATPGLLLLALVEPGDGGKRHFKPEPSLVVAEGATMIVMGDPAAVEQLRKHFGGQRYQVFATAERPAPKTG